MNELSWDSRLTSRGASIHRVQAPVGTVYFKLISGVWMDQVESGGRHHIFLEVLDERGNRMVGVPVHKDNGGKTTSFTEAKPGERWSQSIPLHNAGYAYSISVGDQSDSVSGLGLGTILEPMRPVHTSYGFVFQRATVGHDPYSPGPVVPPVLPPSRGDAEWAAVFRLGEELQEIALRNVQAVGDAPRIAFPQRFGASMGEIGPELTALRGIPLTDEWTPIGRVDWPGGNQVGFEMALCWKRKATS